jgi:hypothetical protein
VDADMTRRIDGWTDQSGGLPLDDAERIVALADGTVTAARYQYGRWRFADDWELSGEVLYWRDLPPHPDAKPEPQPDPADHWEERMLQERWLKARDK